MSQCESRVYCSVCVSVSVVCIAACESRVYCNVCRVLYHSLSLYCQNSLALLRERLLRCGLYQRVLRYGMVLDHEEQSLNAWRVQFWSAFILLLVPCVSALQVYAVKAQFRGPTIYTGFRVRN